MKNKLLFLMIPALMALSSCRKDTGLGLDTDQPSTPQMPDGWTSYKMTMSPMMMVADHSDNLWITGSVGRLGAEQQLEKRSGNNVHDYSSALYPVINLDTRMSSLAVDNSDRLWISAINTSDPLAAGLIMFDGSTIVAYTTANSGLPHNRVLSVTIDASDVKWLRTENALVQFDGTSWNSYDSTNSPLRDCSAVVCSAENVWIGGRHSLVRFDGTTFTKWDASNSAFPAEGIRVMEKDNAGNIWFQGTSVAELWKFDGAVFSSYPLPAESVTEYSYYSLRAEASNGIWLAGTSLLRFDGTAWTTYERPGFIAGGDPRLPAYGRTIYPQLNGIVIKSNSSKWMLQPGFLGDRTLMQFNE